MSLIFFNVMGLTPVRPYKSAPIKAYYVVYLASFTLAASVTLFGTLSLHSMPKCVSSVTMIAPTLIVQTLKPSWCELGLCNMGFTLQLSALAEVSLPSYAFLLLNFLHNSPCLITTDLMPHIYMPPMRLEAGSGAQGTWEPKQLWPTSSWGRKQLTFETLW